MKTFDISIAVAEHHATRCSVRPTYHCTSVSDVRIPTAWSVSGGRQSLA